MSGRDIRLQKLFNKSENAVLVAVDHGVVNGPVGGLEDMAETFKTFYHGIDGILLSPGMLKNVKEMFDFKGAPMPIARINWNSSYCFCWEYEKAYSACMFTAKDAVALGAEAVVISMSLKTGDEKIDTENVGLFSKLSNECREYGLPVIGEIYPSHSGTLPKEEMHDRVMRVSRIMAEIGADVIKTFYTYKFSEVTRCCPIPVLGLGGDATPDPVDSLILAQKIIREGGKGVVFGRNAFQRPDPVSYQKALCEVVKNDADPHEMARKFNLK